MSEPRREVSRSGPKLAPKAAVGRVSLYLRQLEAAQAQGLQTISSSQLGAALGINDAQVRKDLAYFGQFGQPGLGYRIDDLTATLQHILGIDRDWPAALIGVGHLGQALLRYRGFRTRGFQVVALFDVDPSKVGKSIEGLPVHHLDDLPRVAAQTPIRMAILCIPAEAAQAVADLVVASGVPGILNFAPRAPRVPDHVSVVGVDLSVQLEHLAYQVQTRGPLLAMGSIAETESESDADTDPLPDSEPPPPDSNPPTTRPPSPPFRDPDPLLH